MNWEETLTLSEMSTLGDASTLQALDRSQTTGLNQFLCSPIAYGFEEAHGFESRTDSTMAATADDAAAVAAVLGLGEESEEGSINEEDPPLNEEAIAELRTEFRNSLVRVFGYTEVSAAVIQDKLGLNEPVNLILIWDSDSALESACNNLI
jgi:hypothetical protein